MMSKAGEEGSEEAESSLQMSDSPTSLHSSSPATSRLNSSSGEAEIELDSAESSDVNLTITRVDTDDTTTFSQDGLSETTPSAPPPTSPGLEVHVAKPMGSGKESLAMLHTLPPPKRSYSDGPLFAPKDPFLDLQGKITRFRWTTSHVNLLEELLTSLVGVLKRCIYVTV